MTNLESQIFQYCDQVILSAIHPEDLENSKMLLNELLDFFYLICTAKYETEGHFEMTREEISHWFNLKASQEEIILRIKSGKYKLMGITKDDFFIIKDNIEENGESSINAGTEPEEQTN